MHAMGRMIVVTGQMNRTAAMKPALAMTSGNARQKKEEGGLIMMGKRRVER